MHIVASVFWCFSTICRGRMAAPSMFTSRRWLENVPITAVSRSSSRKCRERTRPPNVRSIQTEGSRHDRPVMPPEPSSSRARRPTAFVGSCRSLARFGCQGVTKKTCGGNHSGEAGDFADAVVQDIAGPAVFLASDLYRLRRRPHHHGGRRLPNRVTVSGVRSQGESQRSNLDALALCPEVLPPRSTRRAHHSVQTSHDGGQLVEQAGGRPYQSSTFRFIPSIEIILAGRGPVPRTVSTLPQAKRWSLR